MKTVKQLMLIGMLIFCIACDEDKSVDPTIMPPATTTGENTFGCLIDGWIYTSGRWGAPEVTYGQNADKNYVLNINVEINLKSYLTLSIINPKQGTTVAYTNVQFENQSLQDGEANITQMNDSVISGTFSGKRITKGRFDLKYPGNNKVHD